MVSKVIRKAKENKKLAVEAAVHGTSIATGTGFIVWLVSLFGIVIPAAAAAFLAGLLVPVVNYYLNKLEN